jgi:hypothetical protein
MARKRWRTLNPPRKRLDQERAVQFDDLVAAGLDGLRKAIAAWTPGFRLNTFARHHIAGAISDAAQDWRNRSGLGGLKSDLHRIIRSHSKWSADRIAQLFATKYKVTRIPGQPRHQTAVEYVAEEQDLAFAAAWKPVSYSEGAVADDKWFVEAGEYVTVVPAAETPAPADIGGPTSGFTKRAAAGYRWGPEKRARNLRSWQRRGKRIVAPAWNDRVWRHQECHTWALLEWMRRQRYADTLIAKSKDTYYEVRDGQFVEPSTKPVPFESKVTAYYRATPFAAAKLIPVVQAESVRHVAPLVDVMIPRSSGLPLRMPNGQNVAGSTFWNGDPVSSVGLPQSAVPLPLNLSGTLRRIGTLNIQPLTTEERIDEQQQWCDLAATTHQRRKDKARE